MKLISKFYIHDRYGQNEISESYVKTLDMSLKTPGVNIPQEE